MIKKLFIYTIALSFLVVPSVSFAVNTNSISNTSYTNYSEQELLTLIAKLQKQLEELRNNTVQCNLSEVNLSVGDGEDLTSKGYVKILQNFLKEKGFFTLEPTGYFGKITKASLLNFQKSNGLSETGELDLATRAYIKTLSCRKTYSVSVKNEIKTEKKEDYKNYGSSYTRVSSISLTGSGSSVSWSVVGYSKDGYKIVWSKNSNPTYPTRENDKYIYLSNPSSLNTTLEAFSGTGTYYVRVCEYLNGVCGVYSNEISVSL